MSGPVERLDTTLSVTPGNSSATCFHARPRVARSWGRSAERRSAHCAPPVPLGADATPSRLVRRNRRGRGAGAGRFTGGSATPPRSTPAWPRRRTHGGRPPCPAPAPTWRPSSRANVAAVSPPNAKVAPPADRFPRTTSRSPRPWPASGATRPASVIPPQEGRDDRRYPAAISRRFAATSGACIIGRCFWLASRGLCADPNSPAFALSNWRKRNVGSASPCRRPRGRRPLPSWSPARRKNSVVSRACPYRLAGHSGDRSWVVFGRILAAEARPDKLFAPSRL